MKLIRNMLLILFLLAAIAFTAGAESPNDLLPDVEGIYLTCDHTLLPAGEDVTWTLTFEGADPADYEIGWELFFRGMEDASNTYYLQDSGTISGDTLLVNIPYEGRYMILLTITAASGESMQFFSNYYSTSGASGLQAKIAEIKKLCVASGAQSDYAIAKFMHDYIINHADYDLNAPRRYDAEGVLLDGAGVCQSYAFAYQMLLQEMGVECLLIEGTAGWGEEHIWNLVRLGSSWFHVDCTWDDPEGGSEIDDYFLRPDNVMTSHKWNKSAYPACENGRYLPIDFFFEDEDDFAAKMTEFAKKGQFAVTVYYTGTDSEFSMAKMSVISFNWNVLYGHEYNVDGSVTWPLSEGPYFRYLIGFALTTDSEISDVYDNVHEDFGYNIVGNEITIVRYLGDAENIIVPSHILGLPVTHIGGHAFSEITSIKTIELPDTIVCIDDGSSGNVLNIGLHGPFSGCTSLTSITIPGSCKYVGEYAFMKCSSLKDVVLEEGVETLKISTFEACPLLTELKIPSTLTFFGQNIICGTQVRQLDFPACTVIFNNTQNCTTLQSVNFAPGNPEFSSVDGVVYWNPCGKRLYLYPPARTDTELILPEDCTEIAAYALEGEMYLKSLTLPSTFKLVDYDVHWPEHLAEIKVAEDNKELVAVDKVLYSKDMTQLVVVPYGLERDTYIMPDTVVQMRYWSMWKLKNVKRIVIGKNFKADRGWLAYCDVLEEVIYPRDGVQKQILQTQSCHELKHVQLPDGLEKLPNNTFYECYRLENVILPDGLKTIDSQAFCNCTGVDEIYIPPSVTTIGVNAFMGTRTAILVKIPEYPEYLAELAFGDTREVTIVCPDPAMEAYAERNGYKWLSSFWCSGDVNEDHRVDTADAMLLMQHISGEAVPINRTTADVDANGKLDKNDLMLLLQYAAGWDVELPHWSELMK